MDYEKLLKQQNEKFLKAAQEYAESQGLVFPENYSLIWYIDGGLVKDGEQVFLEVDMPPGGGFVFTKPQAEQIA